VQIELASIALKYRVTVHLFTLSNLQVLLPKPRERRVREWLCV